MVDVTLVQRYVVARITRIGLKEGCEFPNYGGRAAGLNDRIMKLFGIVETGYLQQCISGKLDLPDSTKVHDLIVKMVDEKKFEELIDFWKEICNQERLLEYNFMDWPFIIDKILAEAGYVIDILLRINSKGLSTGYKTVENAFKAVCDNCDKASTAKDQTHHEKYIDKLERILFSYPFLQEEFIKQMFSEQYLNELKKSSDVKSMRIADIKSTILSRYHSFTERNRVPNVPKAEVKAKEVKEASDKMSEAMKRRHAPAEPYVRFMGTDHLIHAKITFGVHEKRVHQEFNMIHHALLELAQEKDTPYRTYLKGFIKSIVHRSFEQEKLCHDVLIAPSDWDEFSKQDPRKRGMIIDELLDNAHAPKVEIKKDEDTLSPFPEYPNLTEEEEPVSQPKVNVPGEQEESVYMELVKTVHPEVYEIIVAIEKDLGKKLQYEEVNAVLRDYVTGKPAFKRSFRYQLPEDLASKVVIKGDPADPTVQKLAAMFNVDINEVKPVTPKEPVDHHARIVKDLSDILKHYATEMPTDPETIAAINSLVEKLESRSTFKSRLTQNLDQRKTGMDQAIDAIYKDDVRATAQQLAKELEGIFLELTKIDPRKLELNLDEVCVDPSCPVHGKKKVNVIQDLLKTKRSDGESLHEHQQRIVDFLVGINPEVEGHTGFINPNGGKQRSEGSFDFSGMLKFMENYYNPEPKKPTVTEIETDSNVVINQKFVIYDAKGEFSCEYKMTWTPTTVQFRFTHDKPESERGRRFYPIRELNKPMTQDKAFAYFQSLRRAVIADGAHRPKVNPYTGY